jgi:hypothetical protein
MLNQGEVVREGKHVKDSYIDKKHVTSGLELVERCERSERKTLALTTQTNEL